MLEGSADDRRCVFIGRQLNLLTIYRASFYSVPSTSQRVGSAGSSGPRVMTHGSWVVGRQ